VTWHGAEHIEAGLAAGCGIVLLTPHMGSFEVAAQAYAERFGARQPITVLYRPARQAWLRELEETARARPALATAPASLSGVRQMMRALKRGETLGLLPDQVPPEGMGVWVPFFSQPAYTMTLAARLALQTGAMPLLIWGERLPRGAGYVIHVSPLAEAVPAAEAGGDLSAAAAAMNRNMERMIQAKPSQYLWGYHRYKQPRPADAGAAAA
jgi:KDO2-lipid IV(A) lauroyltransferase